FIATSDDLSGVMVEAPPVAVAPSTPAPGSTGAAPTGASPAAVPGAAPTAEPSGPGEPTEAPAEPTPLPRDPPAARADDAPLDPRSDETNRRPVALITLRIDSLPRGAVIVRKSDGVRLGETPYTYETEPRNGAIQLVLRHRGYADEDVTLPANRSAERTFPLRRSSGRGRAPSLD